MSEDMTIQEIIKRFLLENKYDGLFNDDCACENAHLFPCSQVDVSCEAGFKVPCDCGDHGFHIARTALASPTPEPEPVTVEVEELAQEIASAVRGNLIFRDSYYINTAKYLLSKFKVERKP